jgi:tight adherence protein B
MHSLSFATAAGVFGLLVISVGIVATYLWAKQRERALVVKRLSAIIPPPVRVLAIAARSTQDREQKSFSDFVAKPKLAYVERLIERAGLNHSVVNLLKLEGLLLLAPPIIFFGLAMPIEWGVLAGLCLAAAPAIALFTMAENRRIKFTEQLPDAIDLMVSVLRSGLSVLQAVKSVAEESPAPCGAEFAEVLHRLNLGQSLPDALTYSVDRFGSFELDLVRRATGIQLEVGGSLGELLDKTNSTLRQRLKLKRHVRVLTSQSRLSGVIIGLMPFLIAGMFEYMRPGYLTPLVTTGLGKIFLGSAIALQVLGVYLVNKLSTFKV